MDALLIVHVGARIFNNFARAFDDFFAVGFEAINHIGLKVGGLSAFSAFFLGDEGFECVRVIIEEGRVFLEKGDDVVFCERHVCRRFYMGVCHGADSSTMRL